MNRLSSIVLHAGGAAMFSYSLYYELTFVRVPSHLRGKPPFDALAAFPGKWKYLTIWNIVLQTLYFSLALLNDVIGSSELNSKRQSSLQKFRDFLFASWIFPVGVFVCFSFWTLYGIDRALVFPKEMDEIFPSWLNQAMHTGPVCLVLIELLAVAKLSPSATFAIMANLSFSAVYTACVVFWGLFALDPNLLGPEELFQVVSPWYNHAIHTGPIFFVVAENLVTIVNYPPAWVGSVTLLAGYVLYMSWVIWVHSISGVWAYPILGLFNLYQRAAFFGGCAIAILCCYFLGDIICKKRWGTQEGGKAGPGKAAKGGKGKRKTK